MAIAQYTFEFGIHRKHSVIWIRFEKDYNLIKSLKKNLHVKWSASKKCWYAWDSNHNRSILNLPERNLGKDALSKISETNIFALQNMENELKLLAYSENTCRTYLIELAQLLYLLKNYNVNDLTPENLKSYFLYCIKVQNIKENQLYSRINVVRFYFEKVLKRDKFFCEIPRPQRQQRLPKAINTGDINKMLSKIENKKHLLIIKLCYEMGLRVSEITNLKITDIDSKKMQVHLQDSIGKKNRCVPLLTSVLDELKEYYNEYKPIEYLFEGQFGGKYSIRSVQNVFKTAMKKAKINKKVGIYGLRQNYATQLLEMGTDIRFIQELLGHNSIQTKEINTDVSHMNAASIKSPLDGYSKL